MTLEIIYNVISNTAFRELFNSVDRIFEIIKYGPSHKTIYRALIIFTKVSNDVKFLKLQTIQANLMEILYYIRFLFYHRKEFNNEKSFSLGDYFPDDNKYNEYKKQSG